MRIPRLPLRSPQLTLALAVSAIALAVWIVPLINGPVLELNTASDEAAHYVTGLMIRSYLAEGLGTDPVEFASRFYVHYPKVAFGVWPPLFHVALGAWLFLTGPSLAAAFLFASLTTVALGLVLFLSSRESLGIPLAVAAALLFVTFPQVQAATASIMMDTFCALFAVSATVAFGRYLDREHLVDAVLFALLASAAIMTKYNALALALVPPIAIVIERRWSLLTRASLWAMPAIVAAICGPWYFMQRELVVYASEPAPSVSLWQPAAFANSNVLLTQVGIVAIPLVLIGIWDRVFRVKYSNGLWCSLLAMSLGWWAFHSFIYPAAVPRYLIVILAALALFCAAGVHAIATEIPWPSRTFAGNRVRVVACVFVLVTVAIMRVPAAHERGFAAAADLMLRNPVSPDGTVLVSSDPIGEGAFIAHVATREAAPQTTVLRASKLLARGSWMGLNYAVRYVDRDALLAALDRARVEFIAVDDANPDPHHRQLVAAIENTPDWVRVTPQGGAPLPSAVKLYRRRLSLPPGKPAFELDLKETLGRSIGPQD